AYLNSLLDLDPSQVSLFHSRLYRPDKCLLAIAAPKRLADIEQELNDEQANGISSWQPPPTAPAQPKVLERNFTSGLYWANVPGQPRIVRAAFVMRLPDPSLFASAEWLVMHSCLTLGGQGGRLERMQDEAGLGHVQWRAHIEQTPDALALVLSTTVEHDEAE